MWTWPECGHGQNVDVTRPKEKERGMFPVHVSCTTLVTIMDLWTATYVFPSYCSDPDSLPTHSDCHEVAYAD
jgi:hypothetical protein